MSRPNEMIGCLSYVLSSSQIRAAERTHWTGRDCPVHF